jgi:hypothetical protein
MLPSNASEFDNIKPPSKAGRRGNAGLVVTVVLALALVVIIGVAISRLSSGGLTRPSAAAAPTQAVAAATSEARAATVTAAGSPADAATAQAIQQVIQQVDQAQVQAIETKNPNVMSSTATAEFYQEQVSNNQDLVDNGVTDIKLVNLEWGPITVDGNTATATVWETWSTTFEDGTTEQARDRNVYTLVMDNGSWKVQADDHPDQPSTATPGPSSAP